MELFTLVAQYRAYHLALKDCSAKTVEGYAARLRNVYRDIGPAPVLADMTPQTLQRILLERAKTSPRTCALYRYALIHFCDYLISQQWIQTNMARDLRVPKLSAARREPIPDATIEEMLSACDKLPRPQQICIMARAVLSILSFAALRKSELLNLQVKDVDFTERCIRVWEGKGRKHRAVYPAPECLNALRDWLKVRPADCKHDSLFIRNKSFRLADYGLYALLKQVKAVAGHRNEKMTPHQFRHSAASRLANNGAPLACIQSMLGHKSVVNTAIYVHADAGQQKQYAHLGSLRPVQAVEEVKQETQIKAAPVAGNEQRRRSVVNRDGFGKR